MAKSANSHSDFTDLPLVTLENAGLFIPGDRSRRLVLRDLNWRIMPAAHWVVAGRNGTGKSTLLRLLHGSLWATAGRVQWLGENGPDASPITAKTISALVCPAAQANFQQMGWHITAAEMLAESAGPDQSIASGIQLLARLGASNLADVPVPRLSQGQLRIVLLAIALARRPKLLLLDECADGLDTAHKKLLFDELERIAGHTAIIFTSHRADGLPAWVKDRAWLEDGHLSFIAPQTTPKISFALPAKSASRQKLAHKMENGDAPGPEYLVRVHNADVYVDRCLALRNINWQLKPGEHWRISGANGSGKSTFLRLLAGDETVAAGGGIERFSPKAGAFTTSLEETRKDFCLVSDLGQALYGYPLNGLELVCSGFDNSVGIYREISSQEAELARSLLQMFFGPQTGRVLAAASIRCLSSGQLRGLFLCRAMANNPAVLLLDEPCTGLDELARSAYLELLDRLASGAIAGRKPAIVSVSHHDADAPACINRKAVMKNGELFITA